MDVYVDRALMLPFALGTQTNTSMAFYSQAAAWGSRSGQCSSVLTTRAFAACESRVRSALRVRVPTGIAAYSNAAINGRWGALYYARREEKTHGIHENMHLLSRAGGADTRASDSEAASALGSRHIATPPLHPRASQPQLLAHSRACLQTTRECAHVSSS